MMVRLGLIILSITFMACNGQRASLSHRSDVYIAGFFPYGDGVENAQTGEKYELKLCVVTFL